MCFVFRSNVDSVNGGRGRRGRDAGALITFIDDNVPQRVLQSLTSSRLIIMNCVELFLQHRHLTCVKFSLY